MQVSFVSCAQGLHDGDAVIFAESKWMQIVVEQLRSLTVVHANIGLRSLALSWR